MGSLSLERVQFKFASIIGELCSEPDVLSQFAVWLDLRLAEYKLKGNISLDCSGEEPDPIWLKGLKRGRKTQNRSSNPDDQNQSPFSHGPTGGDNQETFLGETSNNELMSRLSPDITILNDDDQSKVFPVAFHENKFDGSNGRRRSAFKEESKNNWSPSSAKHRRISAAEDTPSNQSLMSVLSVYQGDTHESDAKGDNLSTETKEPLASHLSQPGPSTSHSTLDSETVNYQQGDGSDLVGQKVGNPPLKDEETPCEIAYRNQQVYQEFWDTGRQGAIATRRQSIVNLENLSRQSVTNMVAAAGTFERWLGETNQDLRQILHIPPEELDRLLVDFFINVKRPGGGDYTLLSLQTLRSHLDRYLRECNYAVSMMKSEVFSESRKAFQSRRQQLSKLRAQEALAALNNSHNVWPNTLPSSPVDVSITLNNSPYAQSNLFTTVSNMPSNLSRSGSDPKSEILDNTLLQSDITNSAANGQSSPNHTARS